MRPAVIITTDVEMVHERLPLLGHQRHYKGFQPESFLGISILLGFLLVGGFIGCYLLMIEGQDWYLNTIPYSFVSRASWRAETPTRVSPLRGPVSTVYLTSTNTTSCDDDITDCISFVYALQQNHIHRFNLTDIAYNFLLTENGVIYEGRGWEVETEIEGADHTLSIALIGTFLTVEPSQSQLEELRLLIRECIQWKQLIPCFQLIYDPQVQLSKSTKSWFESGIPHVCHP